VEKDIEHFATLEEVFDRATVMSAFSLIKKKYIDKFNGAIATGKESRVYLAFSPQNKMLAVKIYLTTSAEFKKGMRIYLDENMYKIYLGNFRKAIFEWCKREFNHLKIAYNAKINVPEPITYKDNILVLEFLGSDGKPAPKLNEVILEDYEEVYNKIIEFLEKLYNAEIVHADLSEYNILYHNNQPYLIDFGQSVKITHSNALYFLLRDIKNINKFFRSKKVKVINDFELFEKITKK